MGEQIRFGCIGSGWALRDLYLPAFEVLGNGILAAVCDVDPERARGVGERLGVPWYVNHHEMLSDSPLDAVMVLTPTHQHAEPVIAAAKAGMHVYCEKPMAPTIEEADAMIAACHENEVKLMLALMKRFNPSYQLVKRLIEEGRLGQVFEGRARWDNARAAATATAGYRHSRAAGGGFLQEDGSHPLDQLRWWLGDVEEVSAQILIVASDRVENDDVASVQLKHKSGAISSLHITMLTHCTGEESYEVFGTKATLTVNTDYHTTHSMEPLLIRLHERASTVTDMTLPTSWNVQQEYRQNWQYLKELEHFCNCVLKDEEPAVTGADGRAIVEVINAAYLSAWEGRKVKLPLERSPDLQRVSAEMQSRSPWRLGEEGWWSRY